MQYISDERIDGKYPSRLHSYYPQNNPLKYSHPFLSMSDLFIPENIHDVFKLCRHFSVTSEIIAPIIHKLAESPITRLKYEGTSGTQMETKYRELFEEKLDLRFKLTEAVYDLFTYGNGFLSVTLLPTRRLECPTCKEENINSKEKPNTTKYALRQIHDLTTKEEKHETYKNANDLYFYGTCPECKNRVKFNRIDTNEKSVDKLRIQRWDPNQVTISRINSLDNNTYYYDLPLEERDNIRVWDLSVLEDIPWSYVYSVLNETKLTLNKKTLYHMRSATSSGNWPGWGVPRMLSVLKSLNYYITLMRGNEAVAHGKIQDLTLIFPQVNTGPTATAGQDISSVKSIISQFQSGDKNAVGYTKAPVGVQSLFGNGRAMLITGELELCVRNICAGMGTSSDMLYSSSTYSNQAVQSRIMANQYDLTREDVNTGIRFFQGLISDIMPKYDKETKITLEEYKGPDAISKSQMLAQLRQLGVPVSDKTLLSDLDKDVNTENENIKRETRQKAVATESSEVAKAHIQGRVNSIYAKYDIESQKKLMQAEIDANQQMMEGQIPEHDPALQENQEPVMSETGGLIQTTGVHKDAAELAQELSLLLEQGDKVSFDQQLDKMNTELHPEFMQLTLAYLYELTGRDYTDGTMPVIDDTNQQPPQQPTVESTPDLFEEPNVFKPNQGTEEVVIGNQPQGSSIGPGGPGTIDKPFDQKRSEIPNA